MSQVPIRRKCLFCKDGEYKDLKMPDDFDYSSIIYTNLKEGYTEKMKTDIIVCMSCGNVQSFLRSNPPS